MMESCLPAGLAATLQGGRTGRGWSCGTVSSGRPQVAGAHLEEGAEAQHSKPGESGDSSQKASLHQLQSPEQRLKMSSSRTGHRVGGWQNLSHMTFMC